jgi:hypothetical protein
MQMGPVGPVPPTHSAFKCLLPTGQLTCHNQNFNDMPSRLTSKLLQWHFSGTCKSICHHHHHLTLMGFCLLQWGTTQLGAGMGAVLDSHVGCVISEPLSGPLLASATGASNWLGRIKPAKCHDTMATLCSYYEASSVLSLPADHPCLKQAAHTHFMAPL